MLRRQDQSGAHSYVHGEDYSVFGSLPRILVVDTPASGPNSVPNNRVSSDHIHMVDDAEEWIWNSDSFMKARLTRWRLPHSQSGPPRRT